MKDKVAIVAGAAWGGIGAASALRLAQEGAKVVVNTLSREAKLAETVERIQEAGGEAVPIMGDIVDEGTWRKLIDTALEHFGKVTTLVHNATGLSRGSFRRPRPRVADYSREEWAQAMEGLLGAPQLGAQYCIPEMIRAGGGSIVLISTVNSIITNPLFGVYSAGKAGLNALARSIALEYGRDGIRCNAIAPGQIVGEREAERLALDPAEERACVDCYPIGRYGRPEDIANAALFLASDEAAFVTGITLVADGGLTLQSVEALVRPSFRRRWREDVLVPQPIEGSSENKE
jgi:NAD(P)-dependent dehydrogenase (short-subunit alcohol dehydrogenase family)